MQEFAHDARFRHKEAIPMKEIMKNISKAEVVTLKDQVAYQDG